MAVVKCEFCKHEQDTSKSVICDNCGRRLGRTRTDIPPTPLAEESEEIESTRCPNCGMYSTRSVCGNCGAYIRERGL